MDRGEALLSGLFKNLQGWVAHIRRATGAYEVTLERGARGEFSLVARWKNNGEYRHDFTRSFVFGSTFSLSPNAWAVERRACDHAREIIREILQRRGVL